MAKTSVNNFISKMKVLYDYNITDTDLTTLLLYCLNNALKETAQLFYDYGVWKEITASGSLRTVAGQDWIELDRAIIVGNVSTFTGIANDKIKVVIDGTTYDNISIATCTTIALVVTAINTAVASTVAYTDDNGYLMIKSLTTGSTSSVTIADGTTTGQTVVGDLFSVAAERTATALYDVDDIISISERVNDTVSERVPYIDFVRMQPDPTSNSSNVPEYNAIFNNRLYMRYTPSDSHLIYVDYFKTITDVAAGGTMPFDDKYDNLILHIARYDFLNWKDPNNASAISATIRRRDELKRDMVMTASKNYGINRQSRSRDDYDPYINPGIPES